MTTLQLIKLTCPVCETTFSSQSVVSTNSFGGKRTDFHERAAGTQPLPYLIHTCNRCGYTAAERDFTERTGVEESLKAWVWNSLAGRVEAIARTGSEKYEAAALVAEQTLADARDQADLWLRAAWCAADELDTEAERFYRLKAVDRFIAALDTYDTVERKDRAVITYLVGELWRRIGDLRKATLWFNQVPGEVDDVATQQWVIDAAVQQRDCPRDWFG